jgi:hypothetical protein
MSDKKWVVLTRVSPYDAPQFAVPDVTLGGKPLCPYCYAASDERAHLCIEKVAALDAEAEG